MTSVSASRVTRSSRSLRLALLLFAGVLAAVTVLRAQETPPAPPAAAGTAPVQAAPAPAPAAQQSEPAADAAPSQASPPAPAGKSPARFEPTEKVRADFDVSFPVDI